MKFNKNLLQRRQFISYFGLGIGTVALSLGFKKATTRILILAAVKHDTATAFVMLVFYGMGAGIPLLALAYGGRYFSRHLFNLPKNQLKPLTLDMGM